RKRRRVAEDDIEKSKPLHMPAENGKTDCERRRQDKTDRPPQPGPKCRRNHDGAWRNACIVAVEPRLDGLPQESFGDDKQGKRFNRYSPTRIKSRRQSHRKTSSNNGADVGDETKHKCNDAPKDWAGNANNVQPNCDDDSEQSIHERLKQKKTG